MKKLTILILVVVMVLGLMLLAVRARGPVNKVTGKIGVRVDEEQFSAKLLFDVYETEGDATRGTISWFYVGESEPYQVSDVLCCNVVDENTAWFVIVSDGPTVWMVVKVVDGGSPGAVYDELYFDYVSSELVDACDMVAKAEEDLSFEFEATITEGNLVVHILWRIRVFKLVLVLLRTGNLGLSHPLLSAKNSIRGQASQVHKIESFDSGQFNEWKQSLNFNLTKSQT